MSEIQLKLFDNDGFPLFGEIHNIFPDSESSDLEYKSATNGFPKSFWETYSAFANTQGGLIVLGVSENHGTFKIEGLNSEQLTAYQKNFWNNVNNREIISKNILSDNDIKIVAIGEKSILAFNIPIANRQQRPIYKGKSPLNNTYKRNHEGDYRCTDDEVRRMLADADTSLQHDSRILEGFSMEDIDIDSLKRYRQLFSSDKPTHPWLTLDNLELLRKLGGYRLDRVSKKEGFTLAGILMFGKSDSIVDQEAAPSFFPDYRENLSEDEIVRWTDRIYPDGTWECNLFQFYLKVWPKIATRLPRPFVLEKGKRNDETPAHESLREAFVNTLIHSDYTAPGNIVIESAKDIFKFSNSGTLLVTLHQYYLGGISECRNPSIQKMFLMIGGAEKAGSGVSKIISGWNQFHWHSPYLKLSQQPDRIELNMPLVSILPQSTMENLIQLFGHEVQFLGKEMLTALSICEIEGEISNNRLQYVLNLHKADITTLLQDLCKSGYLLSENKGRWTSYRLNKEKEIINKIDTSESKVDTSESKVDTSKSKVDTSEVKVDTSEVKVDTSEVKVDTSEKLIISPKKLKKEDLHQYIMNICTDYQSIAEIAKNVGRSEDYIKNKILPQMVQQGLLEKKYPHTPNHPGQSYKIVNND